jgi:hypothetical protein
MDSPDIEERPLRIERNPELFAQLPTEQQRAILGRAKYAAYQQGLLQLEDLVHEHRDPRWGSMRTEASLRSLLGDDATRRLGISTR